MEAAVDGPTTCSRSQSLTTEGSWDSNSTMLDEQRVVTGFEAWHEVASGFKAYEVSRMSNKGATSFELKLLRRRRRSSGMQVKSCESGEVVCEKMVTGFMDCWPGEVMAGRTWPLRTEVKSKQIFTEEMNESSTIEDLNQSVESPTDELVEASELNLARMNRFFEAISLLMWSMSESSDFLREVLHWPFIRNQRHYELLSTMLKMKEKLKQFEQAVVHTGRTLLAEELTGWCMMALSSVWRRTGVTGCWVAWILSLSITWLMNRLSWTASVRRSSRTEKKKVARRKSECRLQVRTLVFLSLVRSTQCMQADEQFFQQMSQLAAAATNAASAAEHALTALQTAGGASSSSSSAGVAGTLQAGLTAASKVLRNPDTFDGSDPHGFLTWKFVFTSWLTFAEPKYKAFLEKVEELDHMPAMSAYTEDEQMFSTRLFAILTSYLKGRCLHLVRSGMEQRNGFALWKELHKEYLPSTRARSLALAQALASYPSFAKDKTVLDNVLSYEQLVQEFEKMSGTTYPQELKAATLIRCSENRVREHLQLTIKETTTYKEIREAVLSHEQASKTWSQESIMKSLNVRPDPNGPAPMEVDRVQEKGKGKGKYKGKGKDKGKSWWQFPFGGRGGQQKGKGKFEKGGKSKGKNKGKQGGKSKGKQKGKSSGKKGSDVGQNQCRVCYGYGHWSRDCPQRAQQITETNVQQQQGHQMSTTNTTASASNASTLNTAVRRIFHIGPPSVSTYADSSVCVVIQEINEEEVVETCRKVVILDSGSDVSLLPLSYANENIGESNVRLQDCQGTSLRTAGQQDATLVVFDAKSGEEVEIHHRFLVGNVHNCILSLGELYKSGWMLKSDGPEQFLISPDQEAKIPVMFQRNSFAIEAMICQVTATEIDQELYEVRAVIRLSPNYESELPYGRWDVTNNHPHMRSVGVHFADPRAVWSANFAFRTTLIQKVINPEEGWQVVEVAQKFLEQENPFGRISEIPSGEQYVILTILSDREENLGSFGTLIGGDEPPVPEAQQEDEQEVQMEETTEGEKVEEQEIEGKDIPEFPIIAPSFKPRGTEDTLFIGEMQLTERSSVKDLKEAAKYLKLSSSGSKTKIFNRIRDAYEQSLKRRALEVARQDYAKLCPEPRFVDAPVQPTEKERKLHEVTHLPFKRWCSFCVMGKSKANIKYASDPADVAVRTNPTVQVDIFFQTASNSLLLCVDVWSKFLQVQPLKNKNQGVIGEAIAEFLATLGHYETVELAYDSEPVLAAGARMAKLIRSNNGLHTILQAGKFYDKARTSLAERCIQTVRAQAKTIIAHVQDRAQILFDESHVLHSWAVVHACWLLNRYHVTSATGMTAYLSVKGRPYKGRVCCFGETVYGLDPLQAKYKSQWRPGAWLGKDHMDHDLVLVNNNEVVRCKAVRKTGESWNGELLVNAIVGPWDMRRGVHTKVDTKPIPTPTPELLADTSSKPDETSRASRRDKKRKDGEADQDADDVRKYAEEHPDEDREIEVEAEETNADSGGATSASASAGDAQAEADRSAKRPAEVSAEEMSEDKQQKGRFEKNPPKRKDEVQGGSVTKAVHFDPDLPAQEPVTKAQKKEESKDQERQVRRVEDIELYDEDEQEAEAEEDEDSYDWSQAMASSSEAMLSHEEMKKRGFFSEGNGPPQVSVEELQVLDQQAMLSEVNRLHDLQVIANLEAGENVDDAMKLDTRVVFDWRFREGSWIRRARLVAREFRSGECWMLTPSALRAL